MTEIGKWLLLLVNHWQILVGGGTLAGLFVVFVLLLERWRGWTMPNKWYFLVIIFILIASFMTWRDESQKVDQLTKQLDVKKKNLIIKNNLGEFLSEAVVIQNHCAGVGPALPPDKTVWNLYESWHVRTHDYIKANIDGAEGKIFIDSLTIPLTILPPANWPAVNTKTWICIERSKIRLRELIEKIEKCS